jgi:hypothetical protein
MRTAMAGRMMFLLGALAACASDYGNYLVRWGRQENASWRICRNLGNSTGPDGIPVGER